MTETKTPLALNGLILLVALLIIVTSMHVTITKNDAHKYQFEATDLALYLSRTPSLDFNFEDIITFKQTLDLEIKEGTVFVGRPGEPKKFTYGYVVPPGYLEPVIFSNIDTLYVYRNDNRLVLSDKPRLQKDFFSYELSDSNFDCEITYSVEDFDARVLQGYASSLTGVPLDSIPSDSSTCHIHVLAGDERKISNKLVLRYGASTKNLAESWYNAIGSKDVVLVPNSKLSDSILYVEVYGPTQSMYDAFSKLEALS
jgi:hypothetical protein